MIVLNSLPIIPGNLKEYCKAFWDAKKYSPLSLEEAITFTAPSQGLNSDVALDTVDYTLSGNTITQLANNGTNYANWVINGTGTTKGATGIHLVDDVAGEYARVATSLKPNTQYTIVYTVKAVNIGGAASFSITDGAFTVGAPLTKTLGINKVLLTTVASITNNWLSFKISSGTGTETIDFTDIMLFEGDQTANPLTSQYIAYGTQGVGDVTMLSVGKNHCPTDENAWEQGNYTTSGLIADIVTSNVIRIKDYFSIPITPSIAHTISLNDFVTYRVGYRLVDSSGNILTNVSGISVATSFTPPANAKYIAVVVGRADGGNITPSDIVNIKPQIEKGSTATTYEPYTRSTQTITAVGHKVGIADTVDNNGVRVKRNEVRVLQASDITTLVTTGVNIDYVRIPMPVGGKPRTVAENSSAVLTDFSTPALVAWSDNTSLIGKHCYGTATWVSDEIFYVVAKGTYANLAAAQTALTGKKLIYNLATPITTDAEKVLQASDVTGLSIGTNIDLVKITKPTDYIGYGNISGSYGNAILDGVYYADTSGTYDSTTNIGKLLYNCNNNELWYIVTKGTYANLATAQTALTNKKLYYKLATGISPTPKPITVYPNGTIFVDSSTGVLPTVLIEAKHKYWNDYSGNNVHLQSNNFAWITGSILDNDGAHIEGIDDFLNVVDPTALAKIDITTAPLAVFALIKPATGALSSWILARYTNISAVQYGLYYDADDGLINAGLQTGVSAGSDLYTITQGAWVDVGFIWDGATVQCYINGVASGPSAEFIGTLTSRPNFRVGSIPTGNYFKGDIKGAGIYAGAGVTEANILRHRLQTKRRYGI